MQIADQVGLVIGVLGAPAEGIGFGHGTGSTDDLPEGAFEASPWVFANPMNLRGMRMTPGTTEFSEAGPTAFSSTATMCILLQAHVMRR